jgi:hypothetical protein
MITVPTQAEIAAAEALSKAASEAVAAVPAGPAVAPAVDQPAAIEAKAPAKPFEIGVVTNPRWADTAQTAIICTVTFPNHPMGYTEPHQFLAWPGDVEAHGRELFARCKAGEFGTVAPYVVDLVALDAQMRHDRDMLLRQTDWSQLPDVGEARRAAYAGYRQALRDLPATAGWPTSIVWPDLPKV